MLQIVQDLDKHVDGLPGMRQLRALEQQGIADGTAGRPSASEHPLYATTYRSASFIRRVEAGLVVLSLGEGVRCQACGEVGGGATLAQCACPTQHVGAEERGEFIMCGEGSTTELATFQPYTQLRSLIADGLRMETLYDEDVTHRIHPLQ